MKIVFSKGSISAILVYILTCSFFSKIFGDSPVNLIGLGGRDGVRNLMFNLFSFSIITLVFTIIVGIFHLDKRRWLILNLIGIGISSVSVFIFTLIYLSLFWRNNGL
jgi:hypothetical protein